MWNILKVALPLLIILVLQKLLAVKNRVKGNKYWKIVDFVYATFVELSPFVECACFVEINVWNLNDVMLNMILNVRCLSAIKEKSTGC